jgi:hypothetical protein
MLPQRGAEGIGSVEGQGFAFAVEPAGIAGRLPNSIPRIDPEGRIPEDDEAARREVKGVFLHSFLSIQAANIVPTSYLTIT